MAIPNIWRTTKQRYSLEGAVCQTCNTTTFPPRQHCPHCRQLELAAAARKSGGHYNYFMVFDLPQSTIAATESTMAGDD